MLRVGLTGDLGSGKSTVARMLAERGAVVFSSDDMGRASMQPGEEVYTKIVARFGQEILAVDGAIDRRRLAALAFAEAHPRVEELNAIVHPAVLAAQAQQIAALAASQPHAIAVVESALIFSTIHVPDEADDPNRTYASGTWRARFDCILLVTAPEAEKVARFTDRIAAGRALSPEERARIEADALRRLALQHQTPYARDCLTLHNDGDIEQLELQVDAIWGELLQREQQALAAKP